MKRGRAQHREPPACRRYRPFSRAARSRLALRSALGLLVCGCSHQYWIALDVERAVLRSPTAEFEMYLSDGEGEELRESTRHDLRLYGSDGVHHVLLLPNPVHSGRLAVSGPRDTGSGESIAVHGLAYRRNGGGMKPLRGWDQSAAHACAGTSGRSYVHCELLPPEELAQLEIRDQGGTLVDPDRYRDALEADVYRYRIDFSIDGKAYQIDATFRYEIESRLYYYIPGVP